MVTRYVESELMDPKEYAAEMGSSLASVYRWKKQDRLEIAVLPSGRWKILRNSPTNFQRIPSSPRPGVKNGSRYSL